MPPEIAIEAGGTRLGFEPALGGRAVSWQVGRGSGGAIELLAPRSPQRDHPVEHGMYVMAPWAGRIRGNAIGGRPQPVTYGPWALHGTVLDRPARVVDQGPSWVVFASDALPWAGSVTASWSIEEDGSLATSIAVQCDDDAAEPFPATVGWHPWFRRELDGSSVSIDLPASHRLVRGDDHLPTGELVPHVPAPGTYDDACVVPSRVVELRWRGVVTVRCEASEPWFVVFDQLPDAVCVEPQSGPPDGLEPFGDWQPRLVRPGDPLELSARWSLR